MNVIERKKNFCPSLLLYFSLSLYISLYSHTQYSSFCLERIFAVLVLGLYKTTNGPYVETTKFILLNSLRRYFLV